MEFNISRFAALVISIFLFCGTAVATQISYQATDLDNTTTGEDLWQYAYTVSGDVFDKDIGFTIYFDLGLYDLLDQSPANPNFDWDVITLNSDFSLPDDGLYDALALEDNASLADTFIVSFVWLGGTEGPGEQDFEVYYDGEEFQILETGSTVSASSPVPEPA